jgi:hypothetical protein
MQCLQPAVLAIESSFELAEAQRKRTLYRLDGGSGTDENLRWLLQRGYQVLVIHQHIVKEKKHVNN